MKNIFKIEISFPVGVELSEEFKYNLDKLLTNLCREWEKQNPGQLMWCFGHGFKMMIHPMMIEDDKPIPFDESCYSIEIASREAYEGERNFKKNDKCF